MDYDVSVYTPDLGEAIALQQLLINGFVINNQRIRFLTSLTQTIDYSVVRINARNSDCFEAPATEFLNAVKSVCKKGTLEIEKYDTKNKSIPSIFFTTNWD